MPMIATTINQFDQGKSAVSAACWVAPMARTMRWTGRHDPHTHQLIHGVSSTAPRTVVKPP
jgi:hypothetical protein